MKNRVNIYAILFFMVLPILTISCGSETNSSAETNATSKDLHEHYTITSTQEWIEHVASATDVSIIDDGFLSMDKDLIISIAIELTEVVKGYAFWRESDLWLVTDEMRKKALAQTYIVYGTMKHEELFSAQQLERLHDISLPGLFIAGASNVLGKDNYASIVAEYAQY